MKTYAFCPVSEQKINERVARLNAIFTVLLLLTFAFSQHVILVVFLVIDFFIRAIDFPKFSPIAISSKNIIRYLPVKPQHINAGPKIFAARVGLVLSSLIVVSFLLSFGTFTIILSGILGLFSFLEGVFGLCVACKIYPVLYKLFYSEKFDITE